MTSKTPRTDCVDDAVSPDTNGISGWEQAYFSMLDHARLLERELETMARESHSWWSAAYKHSQDNMFSANKIAHIIKWLEINQPDVFRMGIWDRMPNNEIKQYKFGNVTCSQCGGEFGPGNHGFSHCENHKHLQRIA